MGMCNLIINRKRQMVASLVACNIIIDDVFCGKIKNGSKLCCSLSKENHKIELTWWNKAKNTVFYFKNPDDRDTINITVKFSKSKGKFVLVSKDAMVTEYSCDQKEYFNTVYTLEKRNHSGSNNLIENIDELSGLEFENWCANLLKNNGFENVEVTKSSGDQGVDILAQKNDIKYAIQCKCYSTDLGNSPVQEVHAGKSMYGCHVAVVMTNRHFTSGAKELAKATGVLLWDREKLLEMMSNTVKNNKNVDLANAIEVVLQEGSATASLLQRKLKVGYAYAARLVETMEKMGIISGFTGDKPREIIMSKTDIEAMLNKLK